MSGTDHWALTAAIIAENFTGAIGTVIFVAYLSALCQSPLHTATQYALLTALAAVGRTYLSSGAGFVAEATGWALVLHHQRADRDPEPGAAVVAAGARAFREACAGENSSARQCFVLRVIASENRASGSRPSPAGRRLFGNTCHFLGCPTRTARRRIESLFQTLSRLEMPAGPLSIRWIVPQSPALRRLVAELSVRVLASNSATQTL